MSRSVKSRHETRGAKAFWHDWSAAHPSIHVGVDRASQHVYLVHHPAYPYEFQWDPKKGGKELVANAGAYVRAVNPLLRLATPWVDDLDPPAPPPPPTSLALRWLPFDPDDPRTSCWIERRSAATAAPDERTALLLAGLCLPFTPTGLMFAFGGQGIKVVAHVAPPARDGRCRVRISGVSSTLPDWPAVAIRSAKNIPDLATLTALFPLGPKILAAHGLDPTRHTILEQGLRILPNAGKDPSMKSGGLDLFTRTAPVHDTLEDFAYSLSTRVWFDRKPGSQNFFAATSKLALFSHAAPADARIFRVDPMTKLGAQARLKVRPNRPGQAFAGAAEVRPLNRVKKSSTPGWVALKDGVVMGVRNSPWVEPGANPAHIKRVQRRSRADVRSNTFAAVNAYVHVGELFDRLTEYGFAPAAVLKFVDLPLRVHYRSGIKRGPGKDGKTVNAQVAWASVPPVAAASPPTFTPRPLEMRFALADLALNPGRADTGTNPRRHPLGLACDRRWTWHELGHVLLAGATDALEFPFAHSAGDALAAILHDPDSELARQGHWRYVTFPWVSLPNRFHNRDVERGWGWAGAMYRPERFYATRHGDFPCDKAGYWSEQILSSSLFRLYRALGGDCTDAQGPDKTERRRAAHHAAYLIIKGIQLLGPTSTSPAGTAVDFAMAMIDADIGTVSFGPAASPRLGGAAWKVIRWAFERQGLYADPAAIGPVNAPGLPPDVDVYIEDRRPAATAADKGQYAPVNFSDQEWHAADHAFWVRHAPDDAPGHQSPNAGVDNFVYVNVANRGQFDAKDVQVEVWVAVITPSGRIPRCPGAAWVALSPTGASKHDAPVGTTTQFGPFVWRKPAAGVRYALLAAATCAADPANLDVATALPCALSGGPVEYLVAWDNNLALRTQRV